MARPGINGRGWNPFAEDHGDFQALIGFTD
jgi:hypothetical protein